MKDVIELLSKLLSTDGNNTGAVIFLVVIFIGTFYLIFNSGIKLFLNNKKEYIQSIKDLATEEQKRNSKLENIMESNHDIVRTLTEIVKESKNDYINLKDFISVKFDNVDEKLENHTCKIEKLGSKMAQIETHISGCKAKKERS